MAHRLQSRGQLPDAIGDVLSTGYQVPMFVHSLTRGSLMAGLRWTGNWIALPSAIYFTSFSALTFPAMLSFSTHFFCDTGDGLQNVWNIWWVRKAIVDLHQSPWWTTWLHFPAGTTLLAHTLNPFNGLLGIPASAALSPYQVHNVAVLLGFVGGGVTAFLLSHDVTRAYWPSLAGGFAFTFSGYHFAHAEGHLQLVSLQWVPLFVLCCISDPVCLDTGLTIMTVTKEVGNGRESAEGETDGGTPGRGNARRRTQ